MGETSRRLLLLLVGGVLLLAPLVGVQLSAGAGRAHACVCMETPPPLEALETADAVFSGMVVGREASRGAPSLFEVQVGTVWKGPVTSTTFVEGGPHVMCWFSFEVGKEYLVYASESGGVLGAGWCGRTGLTENKEHDLQFLGEGWVPASGTTRLMPDHVRTRADAVPLLAWSAALLATIAVATILIWRLARSRRRA